MIVRLHDLGRFLDEKLLIVIQSSLCEMESTGIGCNGVELKVANEK